MVGGVPLPSQRNASEKMYCGLYPLTIHEKTANTA